VSRRSDSIFNVEMAVGERTGELLVLEQTEEVAGERRLAEMKSRKGLSEKKKFWKSTRPHENKDWFGMNWLGIHNE